MQNKIFTTQEKLTSPVFWIVMTIGFIATAIAIFAFLPQTIKTIKSKKTSGTSIITFFIYTLANALWFIWGVLHLATAENLDLIKILKNTIMIIANIPCTLWAGIILGIKIYNMYNYGEDCKKWKGKINLKNKNLTNTTNETF